MRRETCKEGTQVSQRCKTLRASPKKPRSALSLGPLTSIPLKGQAERFYAENMRFWVAYLEVLSGLEVLGGYKCGHQLQCYMSHGQNSLSTA